MFIINNNIKSKSKEKHDEIELNIDKQKKIRRKYLRKKLELRQKKQSSIINKIQTYFYIFMRQLGNWNNHCFYQLI